MQNLKSPLSDQELDRLGAFLERVVDGDIPNIEAFDGFITGLAVCPELIQPSEFLSVIQRGRNKDGDLVFAAIAEAEQFMGLVMRHWNDVNAALGRDEPHMPVLLENEEGINPCNDWAKGFYRATRLRTEIWADMLDDEKRGGGMIPILALAFENDPDPEMRPYPEAISPKLREELKVGMIAGALQLYRAFAPERRAMASGRGSRPVRNIKVGPNALCPCGSGKKFKKCCGSPTLH